MSETVTAWSPSTYKLRAQGFAQRLRDAMGWKSINAVAMAKAIGVTPAAITHWRSGRSIPGSVPLTQMADLLATDPRWLLLGADE